MLLPLACCERLLINVPIQRDEPEPSVVLPASAHSQPAAALPGPAGPCAVAGARRSTMMISASSRATTARRLSRSKPTSSSSAESEDDIVTAAMARTCKCSGASRIARESAGSRDPVTIAPLGRNGGTFSSPLPSTDIARFLTFLYFCPLSFLPPCLSAYLTRLIEGHGDKSGFQTGE